MRFITTSEHAQMRLDKFLTEHFPDFSRTHLQKLVQSGQVMVNGQRVTPHYFLKQGDEVTATIEPIADLLVTSNPEIVLNIVHEEPDFIILNKPAGLVVHQAEGHKAPDTLVNGLLARYPEIARVGDDTIRPGIMHRLDADVSGVMVIARTQDMFDHLKRQFKLHEAQKEYIAVVDGAVSPSSGVIEFAIARKGAKMVARPKGAEGRKAVTEYEVMTAGQQDSRTTLRIQTRTGRTHQIRVHLKAKGWPIVGDRLYESKSSKSSEIGKSSRLMLHARRLAFKDLKGERREFIIEPPFV